MANLLNLNAESEANLIGDDTQPALTIQNSGGGNALELEASATIAANATIGVALDLVGTGTASGAVLKISGSQALVSVTTINIGAAADASCYAIRIVAPNGQLKWIPVLDDAAVTGVAV
jgi:hypothetical protein